MFLYLNELSESFKLESLWIDCVFMDKFEWLTDAGIILVLLLCSLRWYPYPSSIVGIFFSIKTKTKTTIELKTNEEQNVIHFWNTLCWSKTRNNRCILLIKRFHQTNCFFVNWFQIHFCSFFSYYYFLCIVSTEKETFDKILIRFSFSIDKKRERRRLNK